MDESQRQREIAEGRSVQVSAYGADLGALEMEALGKARAFFGPDAQIEIVPGYRAFRYDTDPVERRFHAAVTVREVSP